MKLEAEGQEFLRSLVQVIRTAQFLKQNTFSTHFWRFLRRNKLEQLEFKLGFKNTRYKLRNYIFCLNTFHILYNCRLLRKNYKLQSFPWEPLEVLAKCRILTNYNLFQSMRIQHTLRILIYVHSNISSSSYFVSNSDMAFMIRFEFILPADRFFLFPNQIPPPNPFLYL